MTQWKETVNCNTVAFCQDLIYLILHQSVLCSKYHTVTWWITHTHAHTHTSFWSITSKRSGDIFHLKQRTQVTHMETLTYPAALTVMATLVCCRLNPQVHDPDQDHSGELEGSFHHPLLQAALRRSGRGWCMPGWDTWDPGKACFKFLETHISSVMQM